MHTNAGTRHSPLQGLDCTAMNKILSGLFSAKICPTKLCKQKKRKKKRKPLSTFWHLKEKTRYVWNDEPGDQTFTLASLTWRPDGTKFSANSWKNSDVEVNNKYKETKEICPSESKYVHHQGWELRHGNLWWQASQRILRPYCFIYKAPKVFLLVSEYRIRRDTLNCWQE